jgi:hypothetical protein
MVDDDEKFERYAGTDVASIPLDWKLNIIPTSIVPQTIFIVFGQRM